MGEQKKYWKGIEDLTQDPDFLKEQESEFPEQLPVDEFLEKTKLEDTSTSRRDFLKFLGFGLTAASLAACETPVNKAVPYLNKPEEVTPGVANWYASAYFDGNDYSDVLIKTREGRPIKIEGNKQSPFTKGRVNARVHAAVLSLYDNARLKGPLANKKSYSWKAIDKAVKGKLESIAAKGGNIRILSSSIISPSTKEVINVFSKKYPTTKQVVYDAISYSGMRKANEQIFGKAVIPSYDFEKANTVVSFGVDFLANWLSPNEHAAQYGANRKLQDKKSLSRHYQLETNMSLTGSNADVRESIKPSEQGVALLNLYNAIAQKAGAPTFPSKELECDKTIQKAANDLWKNKGKALVVANANDVNSQMVVNRINKLLNSYGNTIDLDRPMYVRQGDEEKVAKLVEEMKNGEVDALILYNTNPAYTLPGSMGFEKAIKKVGTVISFADRLDETAQFAGFVCPDHHHMEAWNDARPVKEHYAVSQPVIRPLFDTRQAQQSLLTWAGTDKDYHTFIKEYWEKHIFPKQNETMLFDAFWTKSLHEGTVSVQESLKSTEDEMNSEAEEEKQEVKKINLADAAKTLVKASEAKGSFEIALYEKTGMGNGSQANNPWLQELPDPVTKACWDNYLTMSPKQMKALGLNTKQGQVQKADVVSLSVNGTTLKVPVLAQPGQAYGTVGLAVGYGRKGAGKAADNVGVNAYSLARFENGTIQYTADNVNVSGSVGKHHIASTQTHHTMMGRAIVKETTFDQYKKDPASGNPPIKFSMMEGHHHVDKPVKDLSLWDKYEEAGHTWNLSIDLSSCIGCGACVVSCQAENNVPVVGKDEVRRGREMHWMRIDRYYSSDAPHDDLDAMEDPSENPEVVYQPVMCQHCNHAPCETVCPVLATSHSTDGLNQMTYNRCVGTRYCANNCPYKVRRFNWFNYTNDGKFSDVNPAMDEMGRMVLNPDVVVRSRGVMEKCSMCVQRIQEGKLTAKKEGRALKDGEIQTACSQSCPTQAIAFGDVNDDRTKAAKWKADERSYTLLEEVGVRPNVNYLTKVRNKNA